MQYVSEVPPSSKPVADKTQDKLTDLVIIVLLFGFAMWWRTVIRIWFSENINDGFEVIFTEESWLSNILGISTTDGTEAILPVEGYIDANFYYIPYILNYSLGWNPYTGSKLLGDNLGGYVYGPLYIFFISFGYFYQGMSVSESIIFSNHFFDSLISVMVYILSKRFTGNLTALVFGFLYNFSPVVLYYFDIRLLNTPQMSFFTLVAIWCFLEHRDTFTIFFFTFATLIKQFPLLLLFPVFMLLIRRYGLKKSMLFFLQFLLFFFLLSLPYILSTPTPYFQRLFSVGQGNREFITLIEARNRDGNSTNLSHTTLLLPEGSFWKSILELPIFYLINYHVLFILVIALFSWLAFSNYRYLEARPHLYFRLFGAFLFLIHATIARGIYKYYLAFLIPFLLLAFVAYIKSNSLNLQLGKSIRSSFEVAFDRNFRNAKPTISYWFHFIHLLASLVACFILGYWGISLFTERDNPQRILFALLFGICIIIAIIKSEPRRKSFPVQSFGVQDSKFSRQPKQFSETHLQKSKAKQQRNRKLHKQKKIGSKAMSKTFSHPAFQNLRKFTPKGIQNFIQNYSLDSTLARGISSLLFWIIPITLLVGLYLIIMSSLFLNVASIFSGFALLFIGIISVPASFFRIFARNNSIKLFSIFTIIVLFLIHRFFIFNNETQFDVFNSFSFNLSQLFLIIFSLAYSVLLTDFIFGVVSQIRIYKEEKRTVGSKIASANLQENLTKFYNFTLLLVVLFFVLHIINSFAIFYFEKNLESYLWFVFSILMIMVTLWFLPRSRKTLSKQYERKILQLETRRFCLDFIFIILGLLVFWSFNVWLLTIDRLLTTLLVLGFGIVLLALLGSNFWKNGYNYSKSSIKAMVNVTLQN